MSIIFRVVFIIAGAVSALFVARDALNFTIIQTFVAVLLVTAIVGAGSLEPAAEDVRAEHGECGGEIVSAGIHAASGRRARDADVISLERVQSK
ncbi:hypothetical protein IVA79_15930 [Bradyrhizobium sp. 138]|uniref:hypothetical protein n=1 Tax=Bradyrhizobium sp. 138 TaxID=2782615 RepID=UPI001FFB0ADB|nr:hypothetical protein [Bradyrhizobium sp. 138]MCK1735427.1 hypothetical protein [Bradyrhizobium sp. 138]